MENEAIGQFEASALMGVHFSRPAKMAKERVLTAHTLRIHKDRTYCFYERRQCEENWQRYTEDRFGRPRQGIEKRYEILRMLSDESRPRIEVDDAICTHEAAGILDCYPTLIPRLAESGKIVGRRLLSLRTGDPRLWIYSRKSCLAHKETYNRMLLEGKKRGRWRGGYIKPFGDDWTSYLINYLDLVRAENLQQQAERPNANQPESQDVSGQFQEPEMRRLIENSNQDPNPYWHFLAAM